MNDDVQIISRTRDIAADNPRLNGLFDGALQYLRPVGELAANINERRAGLDRKCLDEGSLNARMRIALADQTIFECSGFAFIGIAYEILGFRTIFRNEAPLHTGGKPGAASAPEARSLNFLDQLRGSHRPHDFLP